MCRIRHWTWFWPLFLDFVLHVITHYLTLLTGKHRKHSNYCVAPACDCKTRMKHVAEGDTSSPTETWRALPSAATSVTSRTDASVRRFSRADGTRRYQSSVRRIFMAAHVLFVSVSTEPTPKQVRSSCSLVKQHRADSRAPPALAWTPTRSPRKRSLQVSLPCLILMSSLWNTSPFTLA